jgi:hypothetical protein
LTLRDSLPVGYCIKTQYPTGKLIIEQHYSSAVSSLASAMVTVKVLPSAVQ